MTFNELKEKFSSSHKWIEHLNKTLFPEVKLNDKDRIDINLNYWIQFSKLIDETPKRVLANYVFWNFFNENMEKNPLSSRLQKIKADFLHDMKGTGKESVDKSYRSSEKCVARVVDNLPVATIAFYINKHFDTRKREYASEMIEKIKASFQQIINNVSA